MDGASVISSRFPELASNRPLTDRPEPARRERQVGAGARSGQEPRNRGRLPRRPARRPPDGLFLLLPAGTAAAFVGVQLAVFGVLLGGAFAPNHIGMPIVPAGLKVDFLRRQVLMSRNISGGRITGYAMGGLNYQIEHHLFPNMPRPNLKRAQPLVRAHCAKHGVAYTETSLLQSYRIITRYLNALGVRGQDPFRCPLVALYRV